MTTIDRDLAYLRLAVPDLEDFVLSKDLFWPLPGGVASLTSPGMNQLSLGGVLLCRARIAGLNGSQAGDLLHRMDEIRERWRSNWEKKAAREFRSRVELWKKALEELLDPAKGAFSAYPSQVQLRVMLELLGREFDASALPEAEVLRELDRRFKAGTQDGPFVWEPPLQDAFPAEIFWFLYRQRKS